MNEPALFRWRFGQVEFDEARLTLSVAGQPVEMEPRPLQVLACLLHHAGEVVTKQELLDTVWAGRVTVDNVLATAVGKLRKAFGAGGEALIVTLPRVGYRLAAPVERVAVGRGVSPSPLHLSPGDSVPLRPHFELREPLGPGGNSETWLARHRKTGECRVYKLAPDGERLAALKREATLSRFLRESLGPRDDMVRILDWNFAEAPFFLESEYGGPSLLDWCADPAPLAALDRERRLELFLQICDAVSAAHGVGVLHKDLKPANVLIDGDTGAWQLRLTDFGSSRLLAPGALAALGITALGMTITRHPAPGGEGGTPLYLAPELVAGQTTTVRSDLYALGVMLYQWLVGDLRRPLAPGWERDIDDPLLCEDIARATDLEPLRRWGSVAEFSQALRQLSHRRAERRHLADMERRERLASDALARARARRPWVVATVAVLMLGLVASLWLYVQGEQARAQALREAERSAAIIAFWNRELIEAGNPFLADGGADIPLRKVLDRAAQDLPDTFGRDPVTAGSIHQTLGDAYTGLNEYPRAVSEYRKSAARYATALGAASPAATRARLQQARAHVAASELEAARALLEAFPEGGNWREHLPPPVVFTAHTAWAAYHDVVENWSAAANHYEQALRLLPRLELPLSRQLQWRTRAADSFQRVRRFAESEEILRQCLDLAQQGEVPAAQRAAIALQLGAVMLDTDRFAEAEPLLVGAYQSLHTELGEDSERTLSASNLLANLYQWTDRPAEAIRYSRESYAIARRRLGSDHHRTLTLRANLGLILLYSGELDEGVKNLGAAREALAARIGEQVPYVQLFDYYLMEALIEQRQFDRARAALARLDGDLLDAAQPGLMAKQRLEAVDALLRWKRGDGVSVERVGELLAGLEPCDCRLRQILASALGG